MELNPFKKLKQDKVLHFYFVEDGKEDKPVLLVDAKKVDEKAAKPLAKTMKNVCQGKAQLIVNGDGEKELNVWVKGSKPPTLTHGLRRVASQFNVKLAEINYNATEPRAAGSDGKPFDGYGSPDDEQDEADGEENRPSGAYAPEDKDATAALRPATAYAPAADATDGSAPAPAAGKSPRTPRVERPEPAEAANYLDNLDLNPAASAPTSGSAPAKAEASKYTDDLTLNPTAHATAPAQVGATAYTDDLNLNRVPAASAPAAVPAKPLSRDPLRADKEMAQILDRKQAAEARLAQLHAARKPDELEAAYQELKAIRDEMEAAQRRLNAQGVAPKPMGAEYEGEDKKYGWRTARGNPPVLAVVSPNDGAMANIDWCLRSVAAHVKKELKQSADSDVVRAWAANVQALQVKYAAIMTERKGIKDQLFETVRAEPTNHAALVPLLRRLQANDVALTPIGQEIKDGILFNFPEMSDDLSTQILAAPLELDDAALLAKAPAVAASHLEVFAKLAELGESDYTVTEYFDDAERGQHELRIDAAGKVRKASGRKFDTTKRGIGAAQNVKEHEYVMDARTGKLYEFLQASIKKAEKIVHPISGQEVDKSVNIHHSSVLAGGDVAGAGGVTVRKGRITNSSGHYKPGATQMLQTVELLLKQGAFTDQEYVMPDADGKAGPLTGKAKSIFQSVGHIKKRVEPFCRLIETAQEVIARKTAAGENCDREIEFLEELEHEVAVDLEAVKEAERALNAHGAAPANRFLFAQNLADVIFSEIKQDMTGLQVKSLQSTTSSVKDFLSSGGNPQQAGRKRAFLAELNATMARAVTGDDLEALDALIQAQEAELARLTAAAQALPAAEQQEAAKALQPLHTDVVRLKKAVLLKRTAVRKQEADTEADIRASSPEELAEMKDTLVAQLAELTAADAAHGPLANELAQVQHALLLEKPRPELLQKWHDSLLTDLDALTKAVPERVAAGANDSEKTALAKEGNQQIAELTSRLATVAKALGNQKVKEADLKVLAKHMKGIASDLKARNTAHRQFVIFCARPDGRERAAQLGITVVELYEQETGKKAPAVM